MVGGIEGEVIGVCVEDGLFIASSLRLLEVRRLRPGVGPLGAGVRAVAYSLS